MLLHNERNVFLQTTVQTKERLYCTYLQPIVIYACETCSSKKRDEEKLQSFKRNISRKIYGPVYNNSKSFERITNENLQQLYNKPSLHQFLVRRLEWAEHIWRVEGSLIMKVMENRLTRKRPRGRTRKRWFDTMERDLKRVNLLLDMEAALDREK